MCLHPAHANHVERARTYTRGEAQACMRAYIDILNYVGDVGPGDASATTHREIANGIL